MAKMNSNPMFLTTLAVALVWIRSSYGKFTSDAFSKGFASTMEKFASKNPYPWYKDFLQNVVQKNSDTFSFLVLWGELLTALSITAGSILLIVGVKDKKAVILLAGGLFGGMFLNAIFWLASGWTSPSSDSLNLLMFLVETVGLLYVLKLLRT